MKLRPRIRPVLLLAASLTCVVGAQAQQARADSPAQRSRVTRAAPQLEAKAMDLLRAMSGSLTGASSMMFAAVTTYETPTAVGPPLAFSTLAEVLVQRPDKLRVITRGDGKVSEYYYDGKTFTAFAPSEHLVAIAPAPPTLDAALEAVFKNAAIYFPFADVPGADPFRNLSEGLTKAFYVGDSKAVDGTTTDVVAVVGDELFMQIWIGADDKLPRRLRATYRGDPLLLRHQVDLSHWRLDPVVAAEAFASVNAANARRIPLATHSGYAGTSHTNRFGGAPAYGYGGYAPYCRPVGAPYYHPGCYDDCGAAVAAGAAVGLAAGAVAGAAIARANTLPAYPLGADFSTLPAGATCVDRGGVTCYQVGNAWFRPSFGANGVYYSVVPVP